MTVQRRANYKIYILISNSMGYTYFKGSGWHGIINYSRIKPNGLSHFQLDIIKQQWKYIICTTSTSIYQWSKCERVSFSRVLCAPSIGTNWMLTRASLMNFYMHQHVFRSINSSVSSNMQYRQSKPWDEEKWIIVNSHANYMVLHEI